MSNDNKTICTLHERANLFQLIFKMNCFRKRLCGSNMHNYNAKCLGEACVFPFVVGGLQQEKCTRVDGDTRPWCSTKVRWCSVWMNLFSLQRCTIFLTLYSELSFARSPIFFCRNCSSLPKIRLMDNYSIYVHKAI